MTELNPAKNELKKAQDFIEALKQNEDVFKAELELSQQRANTL